MNFNVQEKIKVRVQCCADFLNEFSCIFFALCGQFLAYKINGRFPCSAKFLMLLIYESLRSPK